MVRRQQDFRGPHEVHIVVGEVVHVLRGLSEEAGARHGLRADQSRQDDR